MEGVRETETFENGGDDEIALSPETLAALQEFYREQQQQQNNNVNENWELSQFWYTEKTAEILAQECVRLLDCLENSNIAKIAFLCCPTVFQTLYNSDEKIRDRIHLFEYDKRFGRNFENSYTFYDYNHPIDGFPVEFRSNFDIFLIDPPFLSEECLCKVAKTVEFLAKSRQHSKIILCTGAIMESLAFSLFHATPCEFRPRHVSKLSNEFFCYVNYNDVEFLNSHKND